MKKRVEKVWEWIDSTNSFLTKGKWYAEIPTISSSSICVIDDNGDKSHWSKERFKAVTEREILEFEGFNLDVFGKNQYSLEIISKVDLWNYEIKVIATPKDKTYEGKSREQLIQIINELKSKE